MIEIAVNASAQHQMAHAEALRAGFVRHGVAARIVLGNFNARADVVACWGWRNGRRHAARGARVLVMERGYLGDRFAWTSLGWDGLNGRARFPTVDDGGMRALQHFERLLQERRAEGAYALVLDQVRGDMSLTGDDGAEVDILGWTAVAAARLAAVTGLPVKLRPHPVEWERSGAAGAALAGLEVLPPSGDRGGTLAAALAGAAAVAAYNSNSLTDAALAGVPLLADDPGAMAWPIAGQGLGDRPRLGPRAPWLARLAWCQWRLEEIADGRAWEFLRGAIEPGSGWRVVDSVSALAPCRPPTHGAAAAQEPRAGAA